VVKAEDFGAHLVGFWTHGYWQAFVAKRNLKKVTPLA